MKAKLSAPVISCVAALFTTEPVFADQISVPHEFFAGTRAKANEVNENFAILVAESNLQDARLSSQDSRLESLEAIDRTPSDQLVCNGGSSWAITPPMRVFCHQSSEPGVISQLTFPGIVTTGWTLIAVGNGVFVFNKYNNGDAP